MPEKMFKPLSLAQYFDAPDEFVGHFGWLCGYSGDAEFLNDAVERFTRQIDRQRAYAGNIALAVMLDPGNPQISCTVTPGILHLPIATRKKPFNLLHAKIALLGFRHAIARQRWRLRMIVCTGNWTRETLEESLDLAWVIEISSDELTRGLDDAARQRCADFKAAWNLLDWLRGYFDCRALSAGSDDRQQPGKEFEEWIGIVSGKRGLPRPRFFDSRGGSLLAQLQEMINATGTGVARNYLGMGSGFYEAPGLGDAVPSVLADIVERLKEAGLLTRTAEVDVFVNPNACQAVASAVSAIREHGWQVRRAGRPDYFRAERALHAKFVFSANWRDNSNACNSAWLYLGSGNLTSAGFSQKMSKAGGNLEAGVVFTPERLLWSFEKNAEPYRLVTNVLPVQWDEEYDGTSGNLRAGSEMLVREETFIAAPVAYLKWCPERVERGGWLTVPDQETEPFEVLDSEGAICRWDEEKRIWWPDRQPREVRIQWRADSQHHHAIVPVLDEFGRLAATKLGSLGIEEAWLQLASFPMPPDEDDLPDDDGPIANDIAALRAQTVRTGDSEYPVRQMMQLIENIAVKQIAIGAADWTTWCIRLEQTLTQAKENDVLQLFQGLALNPLSPLRHPPFRPEYAETSGSTEGNRYEGVLRRIETAWELVGLDQLEGSRETDF